MHIELSTSTVWRTRECCALLDIVKLRLNLVNYISLVRYQLAKYQVVINLGVKPDREKEKTFTHIYYTEICQITTNICWVNFCQIIFKAFTYELFNYAMNQT